MSLRFTRKWCQQCRAMQDAWEDSRCICGSELLPDERDVEESEHYCEACTRHAYVVHDDMLDFWFCEMHGELGWKQLGSPKNWRLVPRTFDFRPICPKCRSQMRKLDQPVATPWYCHQCGVLTDDHSSFLLHIAIDWTWETKPYVPEEVRETLIPPPPVAINYRQNRLVPPSKPKKNIRRAVLAVAIAAAGALGFAVGSVWP